MSTFTHEFNGQIFGQDFVSGGVASVLNSTATEFEYISVEGHRHIVTGQFTYGSGVTPSGTISSIQIDLGDDGDIDVSMDYTTPITATSNAFSGTSDTFWTTVLKPIDTHNLLSQASSATAYAADGASLGTGVGTFIAGNDEVNVSGRYDVSGDIQRLVSSSGVTLEGGDDVFTVNAPSTANYINLVGDAFSAGTGTVVNSGDDTFTDISRTDQLGLFTITGDVEFVNNATLNGGDDIIIGGNNGLEIVGDAYWVEEGSTVNGGDDTITDSSADDIIYGDVDSFFADMDPVPYTTTLNAGNDTIEGGDGDDTIFGDLGDDIINGGDDDDTLVGERGNDQINGDAGNDLIIATFGNDAIDGGAGFDTVDYLENARMIVNLDSVARDGDDYLRDRGGNDTLVGGEGDNELLGDSGADTVDYSGTNGVVLLDLQNGNAFHSGGDFDTLTSIEWAIGSSFDDEFFGDVFNNRFYGSFGDDLLDGRDGNDLLFGEVGDDSLNGGNGNDRLYGGDGMDGLQGGAGVDVLDGGAGDDVLLGGDGGDRLFGRDGVDHLIGGEGTDILTAGFDDDILEGGNDRDFLRGNEGDDRLIGGEGDDRIDGGEGDNDTAVFSGDASDYLITVNNGVVVVEDNNLTNGNDGRDVLTTVEFLEFTDGIVDVAGL